MLVILAIGAVAWLFSVIIADVSFVDSLWSLFFPRAAVVFVSTARRCLHAALIVLALVTVWSLRLSVYITIRNWGEGEDYRYQTIRANNDPGFAFKSLYIVFGLQGVLAWIISAPLLPVMSAAERTRSAGSGRRVALGTGFVFEAGGDYQLQRFKKDPATRARCSTRACGA